MAAAEPARPRRASSHAAGDGEGQARERPGRAPRRRSGKAGAAVAMRAAAQQLAELLGRLPDSVSSLKPTEDGWEAHVEVVELERIPDTTSVMASYRVALDEDGELISYERTRRYTRGMIDRPT
ncbi:gas vesicle protein [Streptomyces sp. NPDC091204]|uniref:gas vesicle protein GvpO n=1 Tax=Streptomyces sp. NPDC091204 TaxID=3155299 RepID=UPI0034219436